MLGVAQVDQLANIPLVLLQQLPELFHAESDFTSKFGDGGGGGVAPDWQKR